VVDVDSVLLCININVYHLREGMLGGFIDDIRMASLTLSEFFSSLFVLWAILSENNKKNLKNYFAMHLNKDFISNTA
jgi:hypothetical protein